MLWGVTLRSPYPAARIRSIDLGPALAVPGVYAVLTADDVPGDKRYGLEFQDQPVLAMDVVRYQGEPVAPGRGRAPGDGPAGRRADRRRLRGARAGHRRPGRAGARGPRGAPGADAGRGAQPGGGAAAPARQPDPAPEDPQGRPRTPTADVVVEGDYEVGMQDQAFLGPESGLAVPAEDGGVDLYVATQWLHVDQQQICGALGLPPEKVRLTLAGVGGAFGGREDLSMHVHACLLAMHTGKPVKMSYNREESFFGHVHRHPARLHYEHGVHPRRRPGLRPRHDLARRRRLRVQQRGRRRQRRADGHRPLRRAERAHGLLRRLHEQPAVRRDAWLRRGAGGVRLRVADGQGGRRARHRPGRAALPQRDGGGLDRADRAGGRQRRHRWPTCSAGCRRCRCRRTGSASDLRAAARRGREHHPRRGRTPRRRLRGGVQEHRVLRGLRRLLDRPGTARGDRRRAGGHRAHRGGRGGAGPGHRAAADRAHRARRRAGRGRAGGHRGRQRRLVVGVPADLRDRRRGAARRAGGCAPGASPRRRARRRWDGRSTTRDRWWPCSGTTRSRRPSSGGTGPTEAVDPSTGQGNAHVQYAFAAHRAVVDVDVELGLVKVVELACTQDVGKAVNPQAVVGQIHGGSAQGLGLALMEEVVVQDGIIRNPSFTDYLIPTILDMPPMTVEVLELRRPARAVRAARRRRAAHHLLGAGGAGRGPCGDRAVPQPGADPSRAHLPAPESRRMTDLVLHAARAVLPAAAGEQAVTRHRRGRSDRRRRAAGPLGHRRAGRRGGRARRRRRPAARAGRHPRARERAGAHRVGGVRLGDPRRRGRRRDDDRRHAAQQPAADAGPRGAGGQAGGCRGQVPGGRRLLGRRRARQPRPAGRAARRRGDGRQVLPARLRGRGVPGAVVGRPARRGRGGGGGRRTAAGARRGPRRPVRRAGGQPARRTGRSSRRARTAPRTARSTPSSTRPGGPAPGCTSCTSPAPRPCRRWRPRRPTGCG